MQIHEAPRILLNLARIQKASRKLHAEPNVGRASAPLPSQRLVAHCWLLLLQLVRLMLMHHRVRLAGVAAALRYVASGTCSCNGVHGSGASNSIGEGRFAGAYISSEQKKETNLLFSCNVIIIVYESSFFFIGIWSRICNYDNREKR